ncbi:HAMP domain-containing histidine kinase [Thermoclostridium stercorarium]|uniref:sensor histidine kinase n=1 Tax=Thermoclostridium stercorarium TaxID=1510 RepID=UPI002248DE54|nr:HAMP domain-containing sensor histidine kinase [Thermoclostridium stercorarium]UZQ86514.1 HAMP domain-containing histidine kinase [Thermoclostridium stercorarium]
MMNKLTYSLAGKVVAIFLFVMQVMVFIGGVIGVIVLYQYGFYETNVESIKEEIFENITREYASSVYYRYFIPNKDNPERLNNHIKDIPVRSTNFFFILKNSDGDILLSNYSGQEYQYAWMFNFSNIRYISDVSGNSDVDEIYENYAMECFVKNPLDSDDLYYTVDRLVNFAYKIRYALIPVILLSLVLSIILFIFLMCSAGRRKGKDGVVPNGIDKIPFDLLLTTVLIVVVAEAALFFNYVSYLDTIGFIIFFVLFAIVDVLLFLLVCMSFATRYKMGKWWKNTLIYRVISIIIRFFKMFLNFMKYFFQNLPVVVKTLFVLSGIVFLEFIGLYIGIYNTDFLIMFWILEKIILIPLIILVSINLQKLKKGGQKIAAGDLNYQIDTKYMFWDFKQHGENLNRIGEGMAKAVEERLKSERFKTELITNVSHDIKTPLTSIINYVDLIKKEKIENEKLKEYIDVLDRQSMRLKKLSEDLIEASKASTGNLPVNLSMTEIGVLFTQAVGEYEERIKNAGLELVLNKPEEEIYILADGRHLWRVFDNLLSNICKYSMSGTRVYISLEKINGQAVIIFRNISKYPLNISSDELLERFVRGDRSRNTEGSGLGLSIAKSLTELQKGKLELYIDGDLFKVILKFDTVS